LIQIGEKALKNDDFLKVCHCEFFKKHRKIWTFEKHASRYHM